MKRRSRADVDIYRGSEKIATIPITPDSRRRFKLMEEDSITLDFFSDEQIESYVGDYINDELFGRFYLCEEQKPEYANESAGYKYKLRFDNQYWLWNKHVFMLTRNGKRSEAVWNLTSNLQTCLDEVARNVHTLGYSYCGNDYEFVILDSVPNPSEVKALTFNGTYIIDAMTEIAEKWECEWWVEYASTQATVYFGKCEKSSQEIAGEEEATFALNETMESMQVNRDSNKFVNRVYAFGGTQNIPTSYRRVLDNLLVGRGERRYIHNNSTEHDYDNDYVVAHWLKDKAGKQCKIDMGMFGSLGGTEKILPNGSRYFSAGEHMLTGVSWETEFSPLPQTESMVSNPYIVEGRVSAHINVPLIINDDSERDVTMTVGVFGVAEKGLISKDVEIAKLKSVICHITDDMAMTSIEEDIDVSFKGQLPKISDGYYYKKLAIVLYYEASSNVSPDIANLAGTCVPIAGMIDPEIEINYKRDWVRTKILIDGIDTNVIFTNGLSYYENEEEHLDYSTYFLIARDYQTELDEGVGVKLKTIDEGGDFVPYLLPQSLYLEDMDAPDSLTSIAERRLLVPKGIAEYADLRKGLSNINAVEEMVVFEDIFPKIVLVANDIQGVETTEKETLEDGTVKEWSLVKYRLKVNQWGGDIFNFNKDYILPSETLKIKFLTAEDYKNLTRESYRGNGKMYLAGMTFEVKFRSNGTYTIIPNEDYGAKIPNTILKPTAGDPCMLIGFNVAALSDNCVANAESTLAEKRKEYVTALKEGNFTYDCVLFSRELFDVDTILRTGDVFHTADGKKFRLNEVSASYKMYSEGMKVKVKHPILEEDYVYSRIIGYELKLDMPYDSPKYTVGETAAYSRLKKIEKEITKLTN